MFQEREAATYDQSTEHQAPTYRRVMGTCTFPELREMGLLLTDKKKQQKTRICNKHLQGSGRLPGKSQEHVSYLSHS